MDNNIGTMLGAELAKKKPHTLTVILELSYLPVITLYTQLYSPEYQRHLQPKTSINYKPI
ncbi:hypothetical protein DSUL_20339 [Desulfovibrionales bacterium]